MRPIKTFRSIGLDFIVWGRVQEYMENVERKENRQIDIDQAFTELITMGTAWYLEKTQRWQQSLDSSAAGSQAG